LPEYWQYACLDTILTARLWDTLAPRLDYLFLHRVYDLEMNTSTILRGMMSRGIRVDLDYCSMMFDRLSAYLVELAAWIYERYKVEPSSNKNVGAKLMSEGVPMTALTPGGDVSVTADVLEGIDHPLARYVVDYRKAQKICGTYFKALLEKTDGGIAHCQINQCGAKTGRMTIREPGLQTIPRGSVVRDAFIPNEGEVLVSIDYKQIEMRILAAYAHEESMIAAFQAGRDLHTETAAIVFETDKPTEAQRQVSKNGNFAVLYGAGPNKFAVTANVSLEIARSFYARYAQVFPGIVQFQRSVPLEGRRNVDQIGMNAIRTKSGRIVPLDSKDGEYMLVNYKIQGSAADVLKEALCSLDQAGLSQYTLLPIHDEVLFSFPREDAEELTAIAIDAMTDRTSYPVVLEVDASEPLTRWGDKGRGKK
jgi:DNA polymerase I